VSSDGHGYRALKGPCRVGPHLEGQNDKHHMPSTQTVPKHRTPKPFKSRLWGLLPFHTRERHDPPKDPNLLHQSKANHLRSWRTLGYGWSKLGTAPHRVIRPGSISPRAMGPSLRVAACGPVRAVTPPKKGLVIKQGRTFLNQRLYAPG
jgi:hypothetical protein